MFKERVARGEKVALGDLCGEFPHLEPALRALHSRAESPCGTEEHTGFPVLDRGPTPGKEPGESPGDHAGGWGLEIPHDRRIGPYRLLSPLGEGGFGCVYLAEQVEALKRRVALKVLKPGMDSKAILARFEAERQALALMSHPSIATVYEAGTTERGHPYFAMEYIPGEPITDYCDRHRLKTRDRLELFAQVCDAVQHAHQKGILHRDLKPSNILVSVHEGRAPFPKVIDFGLAKALAQPLTENTVFTVVGQIIGTPAYMSPEQLERSHLDIDTRTDIYSLGVILYELLTGTLPIESRILREALLTDVPRIVRTTDPPSPSTRISRMGPGSAQAAFQRDTDARGLARQLKGELDWITLKAMEKDRTRRYASASELAADIRRHLGREPVSVGPPGSLYLLRKSLEKHRVGFGTTLAAVVLLFVLWAVVRQQTERRVKDHLLARCRELLQTAESHWLGYPKARDETRSLERRLEEARLALPASAPVWEREKELALWTELRRARDSLEDRYEKTVIGLHQALESAPEASDERRAAQKALEGIYLTRYRETIQKQPDRLGPSHFERLIQAYGSEEARKELQGAGTVSLDSDPPGARVYCFRYEDEEARRVPLPFDPRLGLDDSRKGILANTFLRVEALSDPSESVFQTGDRLLKVKETDVRTLSELARALKETGEEEKVPIELLRGVERVRGTWTPFPAPKSSGLRVRFEGFPLDFVDGCLLGTTGDASTRGIAFSRGSYLLVFRRAGFADARLPLSIPGEGSIEKVKLLKAEDIPPGFIYVPAGDYLAGGDPEAFQSLPWEKSHVPGFFIGRTEITVGEWVEFANALGADSQGYAAPRLLQVKEAISREGDRGIRLIAQALRREALKWDEVQHAWRIEVAEAANWPALGVSRGAALEYAAWRTSREGGRWTYRLPSDLEWEKAARGADRRTYVWGDYLVWSFCLSQEGSGTVEPVGSYPFDESPYGVRDLNGSNCEHTIGLPNPTNPSFQSYRGGSWNVVEDTLFYHLASRNGALPSTYQSEFGLRLAADLTNR